MEKSNQKRLFLGYVIGASTCLNNIHYFCGLVWFGLVPKMQTANQIEPRGSVQKSSEFIRTK